MAMVSFTDGRLIAVGVLPWFGFGFVRSLTFIHNDMIEWFSTSDSIIGALNCLLLIGYALGGLLSAVVIEKWGLRKTSFAAGLATLVGFSIVAVTLQYKMIYILLIVYPMLIGPPFAICIATLNRAIRDHADNAGLVLTVTVLGNVFAAQLLPNIFLLIKRSEDYKFQHIFYLFLIVSILLIIQGVFIPERKFETPDDQARRQSLLNYELQAPHESVTGSYMLGNQLRRVSYHESAMIDASVFSTLADIQREPSDGGPPQTLFGSIFSKGLLKCKSYVLFLAATVLYQGNEGTLFFNISPLLEDYGLTRQQVTRMNTTAIYFEILGKVILIYLMLRCKPLPVFLIAIAMVVVFFSGVVMCFLFGTNMESVATVSLCTFYLFVSWTVSPQFVYLNQTMRESEYFNAAQGLHIFGAMGVSYAIGPLIGGLIVDVCKKMEMHRPYAYAIGFALMGMLAALVTGMRLWCHDRRK